MGDVHRCSATRISCAASEMHSSATFSVEAPFLRFSWDVGRGGDCVTLRIQRRSDGVSPASENSSATTSERWHRLRKRRRSLGSLNGAWVDQTTQVGTMPSLTRRAFSHMVDGIRSTADSSLDGTDISFLHMASASWALPIAHYARDSLT